MSSPHDEDDEWQLLSHARDDIVDDNDAIDDIDAEFDDNDELEQATSPPTSISSSSISSSISSTSSTSTKTKVQSAPLPSMPATSSTGNSLKKYYASHKNKIIASLYNAYNNYSPGSVWQLHPTEPIWLLGRLFAPSTAVGGARTPNGGAPNQHHTSANSNHVVLVNDDGSTVRSAALPPHLREFVDYFRSVLFCSYRKNFPRIAGTQFTTDAGWGCMLRTGQMLLARAVLLQLSPAGWHLTDDDVNSPFSVYRRVVRWFNDEPHDAPFSIHQLIEAQRLACVRRGDGHQLQLNVGSWFTPTEVACIIRDVVRINAALLDNLEIYVARDGELNRRAVEQLATPPPNNSANTGAAAVGEKPWRSVMLLIPVRLGVDTLHESYLQPLRKLLTMPQTLGVFGGRPRQSLYFVGVQGDDVLFLDPHLVQSWQPPHARFDDATNHLAAPQRMRLRDVDPSMTIGFFLRTRTDFDMVLAQLESFSSSAVYFVSVVDQPIVPEQVVTPAASAPAAAAVADQARIGVLSRHIKSHPEGSLVRRRSERTASDPQTSPAPPANVVITPAATQTPDGTTTPGGGSTTESQSSMSHLDICESRLCDDEQCVHALDAGGAFTLWLQKKKWSIVQHSPANGKPLTGSGELSPPGGRWRKRDTSAGSSDDDVELKSETSTKHVATAFIVAHAQGVHVHFRPQLEVMYEREELDQPLWRVTVRYYAHLKPGTASAVTLLTAGLSLVVAANSVSKHMREAPAVVDEIWHVLGVEGTFATQPSSIASSTMSLSIASSSHSVVTPPTSAGDIAVGSPPPPVVLGL